MYRSFLSTLKKSLWAICVSALLIAAGLFFHWFYVLAAGVIATITTIIFIVEELKHGDDTAYIAIGFLLTVVFCIVAFFLPWRKIHFSAWSQTAYLFGLPLHN